MGHCIDCGAEVEEDDKFCPECGATVVKKDKPKPEEKKEEKEKPLKAEGKGSGTRTILLVLAVLFLVSSLAFFVIVVPRATRITTGKARPMPVEITRIEEKRCDIGGKMTCLDVTIHQNSVVFSFQNPLRRDVIITKVWIGGCEPADMKMLLKPGERGAVIVKDCSLGGLGSYAEATVTAQYTMGNEQLEVYGAIAGIVQENLKTAAATPIAVEKVTAERVIAIER